MSELYNVTNIMKTNFLGFRTKVDISTEYNKQININTADMAELSFAAMFNTKCCGTGGSGWDSADLAEVKSACLVQSKKCKQCGKKHDFYTKECDSCGSTKFKYPKDARFGIQVSSHKKYKDDLSQYRFFLLEPVEYEPTCFEYKIDMWVVDPANGHLNNFIDACQSTNINVLPYSEDFYMFQPALVSSCTVNVESDSEIDVNFKFFDPENTNTIYTPEEFEYTIDKSIEKVRKKAFGRPRGMTKRPVH